MRWATLRFAFWTRQRWSASCVTRLRKSGYWSRRRLSRKRATRSRVEPNPYRPGRMRFVCRWLSKPVELHWHYNWWPNGTCSELGRVGVLYDGVVRGEVNVAELLQQRLTRPLAEVIIEGVVGKEKGSGVFLKSLL